MRSVRNLFFHLLLMPLLFIAFPAPAQPFGCDAWQASDIAGFDGNWKLDKDGYMSSSRPESCFWFAFKGDMFGLSYAASAQTGSLELIIDGEFVKLARVEDGRTCVYEAGDAAGEHVLACSSEETGEKAFLVKVPSGEHQVTVRLSSQGSGPFRLESILLKGEALEPVRIKGIPKLAQQLKWDQKLERYASMDRTNPPADDAIVFVGSSTIENWKTLQKDFPGKNVLNRGISGAKTIDLVNYSEHLISPYNPKKVFLYPGDNDIGYKWTPEEILVQVKRLFNIVRTEKPEAEIVIISIKPCPRRMKDIETMKQANEIIREFAESQKNTRYADIFHPMLTPDGNLVPEHYREDGLHLTPEGYKIWKAVLEDYMGEKVYTNPEASVEARVEDLLKRMSLKEKLAYIGGFKGFYIRGIERLDLPEIKLTDGPVGTHKDGRSTAYPAGVLSAATWNRELVHELGKQLGRDSRARGVHILLGPGMNIIRSPLCGRNFEYFTEDPYLNGQIATSYVRGLQEQGVAATLKHYAANNQEWDRNNVSSDIDLRTLHEIYLAGFRTAIVDGGAAAVMDSYNLVNGEHATQNSYLNNTVLRDMWGFDGIVMSDWSATYDPVSAANGGLDLEMPRGKQMNAENLLPALARGQVAEKTIDDKVRHILTVIFKFGFFDNEQLDNTVPLDNPEGAAVALELAREGVVLLKNDKALLPFKPEKIKSVAVIGPNAGTYVSGGGSSYTFPFHSVSILQGLRDKLGTAAVSYAPGVPTLVETVNNSVFYTEAGSDEIGLRAEYFANSRLKGEAAIVKVDTLVNIGNGWHIAAENKGIPFDHCSMRWRGVVRPQKTAPYRFMVRGFDGFRLKVDGNMVIDEWRDQGITTREVSLPLEEGRDYAIELEYFANVHPVDIAFGWREDKLLFDEAVQLASKADAVVVNVGFNESSERESNDRTFALPAHQDSLVRAVAAVNPNTVVLLNAGASADVRAWIDEVPALMHIWYAGQEGGTAVADLLFGDCNPSGKLPISFERKWEDNPSSRFYYDEDGDKRVSYAEGLNVGYRYYDNSDVKPLFPFGHGLSYTDFEYSDLILKKSSGKLLVRFNVTNKGSVDGAETAQLYVRPLNPAVERPLKELKGFCKKMIKAGQTLIFEIELDKAAFSYFDTATSSFIFDHGKYEILIGSSSVDLRLGKTVTLKQL